jgi:ribonuclease HI
MREMVGSWRGLGFRVLPYLDDFLFAEQRDTELTFKSLEKQQARVLSDFDQAGFLLQHSKCHLKFTQEIEHLGTGIDVAAGKFCASERRWDNLQATVQGLLKKKTARAKAMASFAGQAGSMYHAVGPVARMFTRATLRAVADVVDWNVRLPITREILAELRFWRDTPRLRYRTNIWRPARAEAFTATMYSDASDTGWGGWVRGTPAQARGYFMPEERVQSSTWRELKGVLELLRSVPDIIRGKEVTLYTDNQGVERIMQKGASNSQACHDLVVEIFWVCVGLGITLRCHWVPRAKNRLADYLSKIEDKNDWQLNPKWFRALDWKWGAHTIDRFALNNNCVVAKFNSFWYCPGTDGVNAFAQQNWATENNWCNPPFGSIGRLLRLLASENAAATVIVPVWKKQKWWPAVCPDGMHLAEYITDWVELPREHDLFLPGRFNANTRGVGPPSFRVLALRVDFRAGASLARVERRI